MDMFFLVGLPAKLMLASVLLELHSPSLKRRLNWKRRSCDPLQYRWA
jgi:hypothetical protein